MLLPTALLNPLQQFLLTSISHASKTSHRAPLCLKSGAKIVFRAIKTKYFYSLSARYGKKKIANSLLAISLCREGVSHPYVIRFRTASD